MQDPQPLVYSTLSLDSKCLYVTSGTSLPKDHP